MIARRRVLRTLLLGVSVVSAIPAALFGLGWLLFATGPFNPMAAVFVTSFSVRNESGEPLEVWPLGQVAAEPPHVLPLYTQRFPAFEASRSRPFAVPPGSTVQIHYDWDDTNFTQLLVRTRRGTYKTVAVDPDGPAGCCWRHQSDTYVVPLLTRLPDAAESSIAAVADAQRSPRIWPVITICLAALCVSVASWRAQRRLAPVVKAREGAAEGIGADDRAHV